MKARFALKLLAPLPRAPLLRAVAALAVALIVSMPAGAQPVAVPRFEAFSVTDGLPANQVDAIFQDHVGFLWVGTWAGLARYDGASFTTFLRDPDDPTSLGTNWVWDIAEDHAGNLWIGTEGGLSRFDPATETFTNYRHDPADPRSLSHDIVRAVAVDAGGSVWVGTMGGGLDRFDPDPEQGAAAGSFTHFRHDPALPTSRTRNTLFALLPEPDGTLWMGTSQGLSRFDPATGAFTHYERDPAAPGRVAPSSAFALHRDRAGILWVGSFDSGLYRFDGEVFTHYAPDAQRPGALRHPWVLSVFEDHTGTLWVGTDGGGLHRYDPAADAFVRYASDPADAAGINDDRALSLAEDRAGVLWVGTHGGLNRRYPLSEHLAAERHRPNDARSLNVNDVTAFAEDRAGALWVGTDGGGLNRRDPATGTFDYFTKGGPGTLGNDNVMDLVLDDDGALWVATYGGLYRRDPTTGTFSRFAPPTPEANRPGFETTLSLAYLDGHLWAATYNGLYDIDTRTGSAARYAPGPADATAPDYRFVLSVFPERSGVVWVGTFNGGLGRIDTATGTFTHLRHDAKAHGAVRWGQTTTFFRDPKGVLWVGTAEGLVRLEGDTLEGKQYRRADGLPGLDIHGIAEDALGRLWVTTDRGLSRLDPGTDRFVTYDADEGLAVGGVLYQSPRTGTIYVGGTRGYVAFDPRSLGRDAPPAPLVLTGLEVLGEPVRVGRGEAEQPLWTTEALRLRYEDRVVTFTFAALDFRAPASHRYAIRLDGFDEDWREIGAQREATFTNLSPGRYTFRVRVAGSDGEWSEREATLQVQVLPPWWRTTWAYLAYGLMLAGGIFVVDRVQRRRVVARERAAALEREQTLRAEAAEATANYFQAESERQMQELEQARDLQLSLLPAHMPEHSCCELAASMRTATEVGGDYYDYDLDDDGTLTLAIGDATGHGLRAGMMVTAAKSLFMLCARDDDLAAILQLATRSLRRMGMPKLYMALALVRLRGNVLELAGAGLPPALIYRAATGIVESVPLKGLPLGSPLYFPYHTQRVQLDPADTVLLMTDGFPELFNARGAMMGYERAATVLAAVGGASAAEITAHFEEMARAWVGGRAPNDDVTFIVLRARARIPAAPPAQASVDGVLGKAEPMPLHEEAHP